MQICIYMYIYCRYYLNRIQHSSLDSNTNAKSTYAMHSQCAVVYCHIQYMNLMSNIFNAHYYPKNDAFQCQICSLQTISDIITAARFGQVLCYFAFWLEIFGPFSFHLSDSFHLQSSLLVVTFSSSLLSTILMKCISKYICKWFFTMIFSSAFFVENTFLMVEFFFVSVFFLYFEILLCFRKQIEIPLSK